MKEQNNDRSMYRVYANLFSTSKFRQLVESGDMSYVKSKYAKYKPAPDAQISTIGDFYRYIHGVLLSSYRNEYVYKNLIIRKRFLGRHNLNTATVLNEFRIGKSIADLVLLNGTSEVYEIKTELDSLHRLDSQLADYRKVFEHVYIVTHISLADKFAQLTDDRIGILALTPNKTLSLKRKAQRCTDYLDSSAIIKCLRKQEYTDIIKRYFGETPVTKQVDYYSVCKEWFADIPTEVLHNMVVSELKKRTIREKERFESEDITPGELKYLLWNLDFSEENYERFTKIMNLELTG